jgi:CheY-like chemotaxis protein
MPAGGTLRIGLHNRRAGGTSPSELGPGDYVRVSIGDTGVGMDEATLAQAFDPFFTTKEVGSGSGLGLPMVQGFAVQSGGAVRIRSRPGEGTTVELWLPKAAEPPSQAVGPGQVALGVPQRTACILLCDDDHEVRRFVSEFLTSRGYTVHEAGSADAAFLILEEKEAVDLLIADYAMPGINGLEIIRQAQRQRPGLRILLITGNAGVLGSAAADVPLLRKPFGPAELSKAVSQILTA